MGDETQPTTNGTSTGSGRGKDPLVETLIAFGQHATRPLVTIMLTGTLCFAFVWKVIKPEAVEGVSAETFGTIVAGVIAYWFAQRGNDRRASDVVVSTPPGQPTATQVAVTSGTGSGAAPQTP